MADEILHFHADATWETFKMEDDAVERSGGTWSLSGNNLIVHDDQEDSDYRLTFVSEWPTYLRFVTSDPVLDDQRQRVTSIPLAKVYRNAGVDFAGKTFVVDNDECEFGNESDFCGGYVDFGSYNDLAGGGTAMLHIHDQDSTLPVAATWRLAENNALVFETLEETNEVYFYGDDKAGWAVVVSKNASDAVTDVSFENIAPAKTTETIPTGVFAVSSTYGEQLTLDDDTTFLWTDGIETMAGTWSYNQTSGELTLSSEGDVAVRIWFYGPDDSDQHLFFYENYEEDVPVESGFDSLIPVAG
jgi:hypothetical protein